MPWLLGEAICPLQAELANPGGGPFDGLGVEIEGGADANHGSRIDLSEMFGHPLFLLWRPEPDPDNVRMSVVDSLYDAGIFFATTEFDGVRTVCPIQAYLDLVTFKGRGEEAAAAILKEVIEPQW